jgi:hypothetical protein
MSNGPLEIAGGHLKKKKTDAICCRRLSLQLFILHIFWQKNTAVVIGQFVIGASQRPALMPKKYAVSSQTSRSPYSTHKDIHTHTRKNL